MLVHMEIGTFGDSTMNLIWSTGGYFISYTLGIGYERPSCWLNSIE